MSAGEPKVLVIYDGVCGLCNRGVQFILRRDARDRFRFAANDTVAARAALAAAGVASTTLDTLYVIEPSGKAHAKSSAWIEVARRLPFPWPLLVALRIVPRFVRDRVYDFVARNRYRVFGKLDACPMPRPEWRGKFLS